MLWIAVLLVVALVAVAALALAVIGLLMLAGLEERVDELEGGSLGTG